MGMNYDVYYYAVFLKSPVTSAPLDQNILLYPVLKHSQAMLFPSYERMSFTTI
jgi:hypothetical protein